MPHEKGESCNQVPTTRINLKMLEPVFSITLEFHPFFKKLKLLLMGFVLLYSNLRRIPYLLEYNAPSNKMRTLYL